MHKIFTLALTGLLLSGALYAKVSDFNFDISGSTVKTNGATGAITVNDAEFSLRNSSAIVSAPQAAFIAPSKGNPGSVQLSGDTRISLDGKTTIISEATYYPELDELTGKSIRLLGPGSPTWSCQSGTIYRDNVSTGQSSMCWGSALVSCTGSGGNRVKYTSSSSSCA